MDRKAATGVLRRGRWVGKGNQAISRAQLIPPRCLPTLENAHAQAARSMRGRQRWRPFSGTIRK